MKKSIKFTWKYLGKIYTIAVNKKAWIEKAFTISFHL